MLLHDAAHTHQRSSRLVQCFPRGDLVAELVQHVLHVEEKCLRFASLGRTLLFRMFAKHFGREVLQLVQWLVRVRPPFIAVPIPQILL